MLEDQSLVARTDQIGAVLATAIFFLCILIFTTRLLRRPALGLRIGILLELLILPLSYLLWMAPQAQRAPLYYIQLSLMLIFLIVEFSLDYASKTNFRNVRPILIAYVVLFFAGTGGMVGIASHAGQTWTLAASILFLVMAILAFVQRSVTGM